MSRYTCLCGNVVRTVNDGKPGDYYTECEACYQKEQDEKAAKKKKDRERADFEKRFRRSAIDV